MTAVKAPWYHKNDKRGERHIYERHNGVLMEAWEAGVGKDGYTKWVIARNDNDCIQSVAYLRTKMERHCREDFSGDKKFKVLSRCQYRLTVIYCYSYSHEMTEDWYHYGGEIETVRGLMRDLTDPNHNLHVHVTLDLEVACRKAGASSNEIYRFEFPDYPDADLPYRHSMNFGLIRLLSRLTAASQAAA